MVWGGGVVMVMVEWCGGGSGVVALWHGRGWRCGGDVVVMVWW